jgi:polyribonucleotide nucleotidyltransferase
VKRIEVVQPKKISSKKKSVTEVAKTNNAPAVTEVGLGMVIPSTNNKSIKISSITHAKYAVGTLALGYVLKINENLIVVSLPGGITGTITTSEICDYTHRITQSKTKQNVSYLLFIQ